MSRGHEIAAGLAGRERRTGRQSVQTSEENGRTRPGNNQAPGGNAVGNGKIIERGRDLCRGGSGGSNDGFAARRTVKTGMGRSAFGRGATGRAGAGGNDQRSEACKSIFGAATGGGTEKTAFAGAAVECAGAGRPDADRSEEH